MNCSLDKKKLAIVFFYITKPYSGTTTYQACYIYILFQPKKQKNAYCKYA